MRIITKDKAESVVKFARENWRNDGAEGETVHTLCDAVEFLTNLNEKLDVDRVVRIEQHAVLVQAREALEAVRAAPIRALSTYVLDMVDKALDAARKAGA